MAGRAIMLGAGGHARVVLHLAQALGYEVFGVCDPTLPAGETWLGIPALGADEAILEHAPGDVVLLNGLGAAPGGVIRMRLDRDWSARGYRFPALVHPFSHVAPDAHLEAGVQVMAGAIVQSGARIGRGSIVNTRASVDHDCRIGAGTHIAPGATLCGNVDIGSGCHIGAGSVVIEGIQIGDGACLGAGGILVRHLNAGETALGPGAAKPRKGPIA